MASPSTPTRTSSLSRRQRLSKLGSSEFGAAPAAIAVPLSYVDAKLQNHECISIGHKIPNTTAIVPTALIDADNDDDIIYVLRKHTVMIRAPMETYTEIVPYESLPSEVQYNPIETITWAQQTPDYLFLETYAPPQCEICLSHLAKTAASPQLGPKTVLGSASNQDATKAAATAIVIEPYARNIHTVDPTESSQQSGIIATTQMPGCQARSSPLAASAETSNGNFDVILAEQREIPRDSFNPDTNRNSVVKITATTPLSPPLDIPGSFFWSD